MKRTKPRPIGSIIKEWIDEDPSVSEGLNQAKAVAIFLRRTSKISQHFKSVSCKDEVLMVSVRSSAVAQVIRETKQEIIDSINEELLFVAITDIRIFS